MSKKNIEDSWLNYAIIYKDIKKGIIEDNINIEYYRTEEEVNKCVSYYIRSNDVLLLGAFKRLDFNILKDNIVGYIDGELTI